MDLAITATLWLVCAIILFRFGKRFGAQNPFTARWLIVGSILLAAFLAWLSSGKLLWAQWVPLSFVVLLCNTFVILVVVAAGLLVGTHCLSARRERMASIALCTTAVLFLSSAAIRPMLEPLPAKLQENWVEAVCIQSHEATCAPAAAATLLNLHGIAKTERQMAAACLTSRSGTLALGTFRGLCIGTRDSRVRPRALVCSPEEYADSDLNRCLPLLAHVQFEKDEVGHSVVVLERLEGGDWLIADPAVGMQQWSNSYFRRCWNGEGIFMVARNLRSL